MNKRELARNIGSLLDFVKSSEGSEKQWLSPREVAEELGLHINTVYKIIQSGGLPVYNITVRSGDKAYYRIRRSDLEDWLSKKKVKQIRQLTEEVVR